MMRYRTGWYLWMLLIIPVAYGQESGEAYDTEGSEEGVVQDTLITGADLFDGTDPLHITLALDMKEYLKSKYREEYIPVELTYQVNDSLILNRSVRIRARGNFRREHCYLAPFWLNIQNPEDEDTEQQEVSKVKIVTHCRNNSQYNNYVLREYLAYRVFNLLSPVSFRVRLIRMTYVDTGRKGKKTEHWAFMIEPEEMMAERLNGLVIKRDDLGMRLMEPMAMTRVDLYMYMIGNPDYSVTGRHNIKILGLKDFGVNGYTPVPYDFDYSGLVNTYYAVPAEKLGISSVRERIFLGLCREEAQFQAAVDSIGSCRAEILELINTFEYLEEKEKSEMIGYLESYFEEASSPRFISRTLISTCRD